MPLRPPTIRRLAASVLPGLVCLWPWAGCESLPSYPPDTAPGGKKEVQSGANAYTIQPGDLLLISISGEPDFTQQVRVDWNGRINLPYLTGRGTSEIPAAGKSISDLSERIAAFARLHSSFVNPRVQVLVSEYAVQMFVVLGQVNQPGRFPFPHGLPPRMDLEDAIGTAGGYTRLARQSLILVKRGTQVYKVDLRRLTMHPGQPRFIVLPGDAITVTERLF